MNVEEMREQEKLLFCHHTHNAFRLADDHQRSLSATIEVGRHPETANV